MANVAINGLGRIGRAALEILLAGEGLDLVAVNDLADADNLAYLLTYDTVYGRASADDMTRRPRGGVAVAMPTEKACGGPMILRSSHDSQPERHGIRR